MTSIWITGTIKADLVETVGEALAKDTQSIDVYINSYGGCAATSFAVHNMLAADPRVNIHILGAAYSGGAVIGLSKDNFTMTENAQFMFHKASGWVGRGNSNKLKREAGELAYWDKAMRKLFKGLLTDKELAEFDAGKDVYVTAKQISKRLK